MMSKNSLESGKAKKFKNAKKNIFERENPSVFAQILGAIFGFGRYN